jgi:hypothetical protein
VPVWGGVARPGPHHPAITTAGWPVLARSSPKEPKSLDGARHDESYTQTFHHRGIEDILGLDGDAVFLDPLAVSEGEHALGRLLLPRWGPAGQGSAKGQPPPAPGRAQPSAQDRHPNFAVGRRRWPLAVGRHRRRRPYRRFDPGPANRGIEALFGPVRGACAPLLRPRIRTRLLRPGYGLDARTARSYHRPGWRNP